MTVTLDYSELDRLLGDDRLARPQRPLSEGSARGDRDPRPSWDWWYGLTLTERRQLMRFMAPAGSGLQPDDLQQVIGADSIDQALEQWRQACHLARRTVTRDMVSDMEWEATQQALAEIVGPHEIAERLQVELGTVHQWRKRLLMPAPQRVISKVPLWSWAEILGWALETGRAAVEHVEIEPF